MGQIVDLTGQRFGRLEVVGRAPKPVGTKGRLSWWRCLCRCKAEVIVRRDTLENGTRRKCSAECPYRDPRLDLVFSRIVVGSRGESHTECVAQINRDW